MTDTPQLLLAHHLKALKLPTFLREYDKLARQCAAEGEVKDLRREASALKEVVAELTLENRLLKKSVTADGEDGA